MLWIFCRLLNSIRVHEHLQREHELPYNITLLFALEQGRLRFPSRSRPVQVKRRIGPVPTSCSFFLLPFLFSSLLHIIKPRRYQLQERRQLEGIGSIMPSDKPIAAYVLGTIGTILWCVQLVPQIWHNWRHKRTDGLPPTMMFLWALCMLLHHYGHRCHLWGLKETLFCMCSGYGVEC